MENNDKILIFGKARFKVRSDTYENWSTKNPILLSGEPSVVTDGSESEKIKIGDGVTTWNDLLWWKGPKGLDGVGRTTSDGGVIFNDYENNKALGNGSGVFGLSNSAGMDGQFVVGVFNENKCDTSFEVGNGISDESRSNAFEVYKDGHAELKAVSESENSVVNKKYLENAILENNSLSAIKTTEKYEKSKKVTIKNVSELPHRCNCILSADNERSVNICQLNNETVTFNNFSGDEPFTLNTIINDDGSITNNGSVAAYVRPAMSISLKNLEKEQTYTFSFSTNQSQSFTWVFLSWDKDGNPKSDCDWTEYTDTKVKHTFTVSDDGDWYTFGVYYAAGGENGNTVENLIFYPQLELGEKAHEWSAAVNLKNLLKITENTCKAFSGDTGEILGENFQLVINENGSIKLKGYTEGRGCLKFILPDLIAGKTYTFSLRDDKNGNTCSLGAAGLIRPTGGVGLGSDVTENGAKLTFTADVTGDYIVTFVNWGNFSTTTNEWTAGEPYDLTMYPQLEMGESVTDWCEYLYDKVMVSYIDDITKVKLKVTANGHTDTYNVNSDGSVENIIAVFPEMTITTDNEYINIDEFTYVVDIKKYIDAKIESLLQGIS